MNPPWSRDNDGPYRACRPDGGMVEWGASPDILMYRKGRSTIRLSLTALRDAWLEIDALWGAGKEGNDMRYLHQRAPVSLFLSDVLPTTAGWVGILNWLNNARSRPSVMAQHLIRIPIDDPVAIEAVRRLPGDGWETSRPGPRLFSVAGRALLWEPGAIVAIGPRGERRGTFLRLSGGDQPQHLLSGRWLVRRNAFVEASTRGIRIDAVDLQRRQVVPLLREAPVHGGYRSTEIIAADAGSRTLLLQTRTDRSQRPSAALLEVPSGRRHSLPASWATRARWLWQGYVVVDEDDGYGVYEARTGRRVRHFKR